MTLQAWEQLLVREKTIERVSRTMMLMAEKEEIGSGSPLKGLPLTVNETLRVRQYCCIVAWNRLKCTNAKGGKGKDCGVKKKYGFLGDG